MYAPNQDWFLNSLLNSQARVAMKCFEVLTKIIYGRKLLTMFFFTSPLSYWNKIIYHNSLHIRNFDSLYLLKLAEKTWSSVNTVTPVYCHSALSLMHLMTAHSIFSIPFLFRTCSLKVFSKKFQKTSSLDTTHYESRTILYVNLVLKKFRFLISEIQQNHQFNWKIFYSFLDKVCHRRFF